MKEKIGLQCRGTHGNLEKDVGEVTLEKQKGMGLFLASSC